MNSGYETKMNSLKALKVNKRFWEGQEEIKTWKKRTALNVLSLFLSLAFKSQEPRKEPKALIEKPTVENPEEQDDKLFWDIYSIWKVR